ncbi:hypothetical protein SEVIR_5G360533v4 [Setaria viridis]
MPRRLRTHGTHQPHRIRRQAVTRCAWHDFGVSEAAQRPRRAPPPRTPAPCTRTQRTRPCGAPHRAARRFPRARRRTAPRRAVAEVLRQQRRCLLPAMLASVRALISNESISFFGCLEG